MDDETYEYPYGDHQIHDALADLDRRLKALEPKVEEEKPAEEISADDLTKPFDPEAVA